MGSKILSLPIEIITTIFRYLQPDDLVQVGSTCRLLLECSQQDILWRRYCSSWKYWNPESLEEDGAWRKRYITRRQNDVKAGELVLNCVQTPDLIANTTHFVELINRYGQEAIESLMDFYVDLELNDNYTDDLAKRWWSIEMTLLIQRWQALKYLHSHMNDVDFEEEMILVSIEMLVRRDGFMDFEGLEDMLHQNLYEFEDLNPEWETYSPRKLALQIASYMTEVQGVYSNFDREFEFHDPLNSLIGCTLTDAVHHGLPITHAAIYCAYARRSGLKAKVIGYPMHVYVVVYPPRGQTLDGKPALEDAPIERLFINPCAQNERWVLNEQELLAPLRSLPLPPHISPASLLEPLSLDNFVIRVKNNLIRSVHIRRQFGREGIFDVFRTQWFTESAFDGLALANFAENVRASRNPQHLHHERITAQDLDPWEGVPNLRENAPWNAMLCRELLQERPFEGRQLAMPAILPDVQARKSRLVPANNAVLYKVGTPFIHRRYEYRGVIIGWDATCAQTDEWQVMMNVEDLPRGSTQPFYHVKDGDGKDRYVAEENIRPTNDILETEYFLHNAGRWFLRFDQQQGRYISNLKQWYPDD